MESFCEIGIAGWESKWHKTFPQDEENVMERYTITEALAEIKLIDKRVDKKHEFIKTNLLRFDHMPDPFTKDGGSVEYMRRENQSVNDLWSRLIKLRAAITKANVDNTITVEGVTKSIAEWLSWKRDVQENQFNHLNNLVKTLEAHKREHERTPKFMKNDAGEAFIVKPVFNMDLEQIQKDLEKVMIIKERLDGQLSLKNATIVIGID
jgi:hypothetical protein